MRLRWGPDVIALATHEQSAPIVPIAQLLHVELAHSLQFPGIPSHTQVREPQSAMRHQEQPRCELVRSPQCNGGMNQSGQLRNSGKRGKMWPTPLTSGGLALEEVTCRGWGPHLQYSFLIKLASLSGNAVFPFCRKTNRIPCLFASNTYLPSL